jgi:hypothetical protein
LYVLFTKYYSGGHIEKNEMGGTCSTDGERRVVYKVLVGEYPGVDGRIILRWNFLNWGEESVDWI